MECLSVLVPELISRIYIVGFFPRSRGERMFGVPSMYVCPVLTELEAISSTAVRGKFTDSELD